jgi:hypothetical protein
MQQKISIQATPCANPKKKHVNKDLSQKGEVSDKEHPETLSPGATESRKGGLCQNSKTCTNVNTSGLCRDGTLSDKIYYGTKLDARNAMLLGNGGF